MDSTVIQRMRQRKIVQWTIAYLAAGWVLVQVFHPVGQQFNWPAPILRATTVLLAFGVLPAVVVALLGAEVLGIERCRLQRTNTEAYDLYLQGRELWQLREGAMTRRAVEVLEQAVALDPQFAPARSELATALRRMDVFPSAISNLRLSRTRTKCNSAR